MGKVSPPKDRQSRNNRRKRLSIKVNHKYLKPGALAQIRNSKASLASKHCTDLAKKRVAIIKSKPSGADNFIIPQKICKTPVIMSPVRFEFGSVNGYTITTTQSSLLKTPKTPSAADPDSESRLDSLPFDLLVKILCHLHHDQLRAVFHVSQKIRKAIIVARQYHFNYTTPDRTRQEMLNAKTPLPTEHWPFLRKDGGVRIGSPHTPKAPRHGPRLPSRLKSNEMRQIAAVLFQDSSFTPNCLVPSVLSKPPICKSLASNRVLFYEEELCKQASVNQSLEVVFYSVYHICPPLQRLLAANRILYSFVSIFGRL